VGEEVVVAGGAPGTPPGRDPGELAALEQPLADAGSGRVALFAVSDGKAENRGDLCRGEVVFVLAADHDREAERRDRGGFIGQLLAALLDSAEGFTGTERRERCGELLDLFWHGITHSCYRTARTRYWRGFRVSGHVGAFPVVMSIP